jgi:hypothetical protein
MKSHQLSALDEFLAAAKIAKYRMLSVGEVMSILIRIHDEYVAAEKEAQSIAA